MIYMAVMRDGRFLTNVSRTAPLPGLQAIIKPRFTELSTGFGDKQESSIRARH
jgi:hypothetical protein